MFPEVDEIMQHYHPLSASDELAAHDRKDYNALVCSQLACVVQIAIRITKRMGRTDLFDDAISIGMVELAELVRKFDPTRGARLNTFATFSLPSRIFRGIQKLRDDGGIRRYAPSGPKSKWSATGAMAVSLNDLPTGFMKFFLDEKESIQPLCDRLDALELLRTTFLTDREREVLCRRGAGDTLSEIGEGFGISKERVRQIELSAYRKLKNRAAG